MIHKFDVSVTSTVYTYLKLTGTSLYDYNRNPEAGIAAYSEGRKLARETFGDKVRLGGPGTPSISYGFNHAMGVELVFPEDDGEVSFVCPHWDFDEAMSRLDTEFDLSRTGEFPFYLEYLRKLEKAFPNEKIKMSMVAEGPVTDAWIVRGEDFFFDLYDDPDRVKEYLLALPEAIFRYDMALSRLCRPDGPVEQVNCRSTVCDDIAGLVSPELWPEFVIPALKKYFGDSERKQAHVEGMSASHLPYLEEVGVTGYDPSVSPQLTPALISANCSIPFGWRLNTMQFHSLDDDGIRNFVFEAAADGATGCFSYTDSTYCTPESVRKIDIFLKAGKTVKNMFEKGATRQDIAALRNS